MAMLVTTLKLHVLLVFFLATGASSQELRSTLHSTVYGSPIAYVDEMIVFTCIVRGSNSMAWTSNEYIGTGGQRLEFSAAEAAGTRSSAVGNPQTTAVLINATIDEIIESELRIRIISNSPAASVRCHNINAGTNSSIEFFLADATSVDCDKQTVCLGETVTCTCTTGNSNALAWTSNIGNRVLLTSSDPLPTRRNVTGSSAFAVLTDNFITNSIRVITSNFTFIATSSRSTVLACENIDNSASESVIIPVSGYSIMMTVESCADPSSQVTTPAGNESDLSRESCNVPIIAAVVVPVIIALIAALTVFILIMVCGRQYRRIKELEAKKEQLENDVSTKEMQLETMQGELNNKLDQLRSKDKELKKIKEVKEKELQELKKAKNRELEEKRKEIENLKMEFQNVLRSRGRSK